jgi:hypothetical protein
MVENGGRCGDGDWQELDLEADLACAVYLFFECMVMEDEHELEW